MISSLLEIIYMIICVNTRRKIWDKLFFFYCIRFGLNIKLFPTCALYRSVWGDHNAFQRAEQTNRCVLTKKLTLSSVL